MIGVPFFPSSTREAHQPKRLLTVFGAAELGPACCPRSPCAEELNRYER